eukprot:TRINITY_DN26246_c0_g3_i3.p1 TRINITY_DN26246_c0_g3~~TRINITY_DN26246_c0_g3_i3.p1  ORF type:complete len:303 (-),score=53.21 TRINITY_DN26246_c0_g3_i3:57-965(-)
MMTFAYCSYHFQKRRNPRAFRNRKLPNPIERALSLYIQGLIGLSTFLISSGLAPFRCYQQSDGSFTLLQSPDLNCYDEAWLSHLWIVIAGLLEIAAVPVILILIFWFNRLQLNQNEFIWRFGSLTELYVPKYYWWEAVMLVRKMSFVMIVDLTNDWNVQLRTFLLEIVMLTHVLAEHFCQPRQMSSGFAGILFPIFHTYQIFILLVASLVFDSGGEMEVQFFQVFVVMSFLLLCGILVLVIVGTAVQAQKDQALDAAQTVRLDRDTGRVLLSEQFTRHTPELDMTINPLTTTQTIVVVSTNG